MPRAPKTQRKEMSAVLKGKILALHEDSNSMRKIAAKLHIPRSTVQGFMQRFTTRQTHENLVRPGGPRKTTEEEDQRIIEIAERQTRLKYEEVCEIANTTISVRSIRRRLKVHGIRKWKAANCALLNDRLAANRLAWALEHQNWTVEDWRKITWSDEVSVEKGKDPTAVWVFRRRGEREKFLRNNVNGCLKGGGVSLMLWSCFTNDVKGPLVPIFGRANADAYISLLESHLIPYMESLPEHGIIDSKFQQDNAPIHKAHRTMDFLEAQPFETIVWPASSPDMNPIEHIWAAIKAELHRQFPDTKHLPGGPNAVKQVISERLAIVWETIGPDVLTHLVESMPRRIAALIEAEGWYTRY
jgi:transposase